MEQFTPLGIAALSGLSRAEWLGSPAPNFPRPGGPPMNPTADRSRRPFSLDEARPLLARTPRLLDAWLRGLPDAWTRGNEGGESWSPFDVVGHLIHGEKTDWIPRLSRILEHGTTVPFDRMDR